MTRFRGTTVADLPDVTYVVPRLGLVITSVATFNPSTEVYSPSPDFWSVAGMRWSHVDVPSNESRITVSVAP